MTETIQNYLWALLLLLCEFLVRGMSPLWGDCVLHCWEMHSAQWRQGLWAQQLPLTNRLAMGELPSENSAYSERKNALFCNITLKYVKHMNWDSLGWYAFWEYKKEIAKAQEHAHSMNRDWLCCQGKPFAWVLGDTFPLFTLPRKRFGKQTTWNVFPEASQENKTYQASHLF